MEIPRVTIKSHHEAINRLGGMDMFSPLEEFSQQIARATDVAIMSYLDKMIGTGWELERVTMELLPNNDPTKQGTRYQVSYDNKPVGIIRNTVVVQGNKAIGNLYVEMMEVATA